MPNEQRPLKVFLCHASADKPKVRELYRYLRRRAIKPWFDEMDLVGGQDWQVEIPKALSTSDAIIICLTKNSVDKEGYIQKEIKFALDKALEMPEGRIFLIPVRFEECEVPFSLSRYQWVDLFDEAGYARMMKALKFRASQLERATVELPKKDSEEEKLTREKSAREREEREVAEKAAREKAEGDAAERAALEKAERAAAEKAENERIEKVEREKLERVIAEKARVTKAEHNNDEIVHREMAESKVVESSEYEKPKPDAEEKLVRKPSQMEAKKTEPRSSQRNSKPQTRFWTVGMIAVIVALIGILSQFFNPPTVPTATATVTMTLTPAQTATLRLDPTPTLADAPTKISTSTPDYFGTSEVLFAKKDGSIYSFKNNTNSKTGSITVPEWHDSNAGLLDYLWSWDANKEFFIVGGFSYEDVYFIDRTGQSMSGLAIPYINSCPNLSRDGKKIATHSQAVTNGNIWVFNTDGSHFMRLSLSSTMRFGCPAWSPDGETIVAAAGESEESYVVVLDLAGAVTNQFKMSQYVSSMSQSFFWIPPKWSPDGKSLIVCEESGIYRLDIDNGDILKLLSSSVNACDWSPDGKSVVYANTDGLNLLDMNTGGFIRLLDMKDIVSVAWE